MRARPLFFRVFNSFFVGIVAGIVADASDAALAFRDGRTAVACAAIGAGFFPRKFFVRNRWPLLSLGRTMFRILVHALTAVFSSVIIAYSEIN